MGRGTTPIDAALRGRIAAGADANPLGEMLAAPRLDPPSLKEIADWLARFDWEGDADTPDELLAFYHPETLRRIGRLRAAFLERPLDKTAAWIRMVALSRLTGHSPGFFSVRTLPPNQAITAAAQLALASHSQPYPSILLGEMLATSDLPGGVVNLLTGTRADTLPTFATHAHLRAVYAVANKDERTEIQRGAAEHVKRTVFLNAEKPCDWFDEKSQGLYHIRHFLEPKTTWHPVGA